MWYNLFKIAIGGKDLKKKILSITLALCLAFASSAALPQSAFTDTAGISATALTSGDFEYSLLNDGTAEITGYKGSKADLTIPSTISGNTVTSIGTGAFLVNTSLKSVTIPKTIKTIGFSAFSGCMNLKTVTIENGVETIDSMAFSGNTALENVTIPSSVTKIGVYAFSATKWLDDQKKKSPFVIVNEILIDASGCKAAVVIPDTVKTIGSAAFKDLAISSVTFPESVETIDELAFFNCKNLKSVTIPETVKTIGKQAFGYIKLDNGLSAVMKDFAIYGKNKTGAQKYASSNAITFYNKLYTIRLAGKDRYETAVEISKYRSRIYYTSNTVILANGMNYADALAAASLSRFNNAPILLTNTHSLNPATREEIKRLSASNVIILGGENAVGKEVVDELIQIGIRQEDIRRLYGKDRYATAVAIAKDVAKYDSCKSSVFFVYGNGFADSLSIGPVAARSFNPIIYLRTNGEIDEASASFLAEIKGKVENAYVIGGEGVISDDMMKKAAAAVGVDKPIRIAGANRYDTCIEINNYFIRDLYFTELCVATGNDFPDALAGLTYVTVSQYPMFLVNGKSSQPYLTEKQKNLLRYLRSPSLIVFGGTSVVPDSQLYYIGKYTD